MAGGIIEELRPIFMPRSVAVVGASKAPYKWGAQTIHRLLASGYGGAVYPIHPNEKEIQGLASFPSVVDVPGEIDLAVITVPAGAVPKAMRDCVRKGIKGAIVISADFSETGSQGKELQDAMVGIARQGGVRIVGPNCFGLWNAECNLNTLPGSFRKGPVGFISQSGSFSHMLARTAGHKGIGMSKIVSVGNQADLDVADYLAYLANDPGTEAIIMYLEGIGNGRKLADVGRVIQGKKPVIVYKVGRHEGSARVAMSHTAAMIGDDRIFDALCRQVGFLRAPDLYSCLDMAAILTRQPLPGGNRVAIQGTGGQCMILADACLSMGLEVPELREKDIPFVLSGVDFPAHAPVPRNPVDFAGAHTALMDATVLNRMAHLEYIDGLIALRPVTFSMAAGDSAEQGKIDGQVGQLLAAITREYRKPIVLIDPGLPAADGFGTSETLNQVLDSAGILSFQTPEEAARAMYTLVKYARIRQRQ
jgi:acyl-CoA synthetase (NDP forming)